MRDLKPNKVFVSVELSNLSRDKNLENIAKARDILRREDVRTIEVNGVYKSVAEKSFLLASTDIAVHLDNLEVARNLARLFNQESILEVSNDDKATLHYTDGSSKVLGTFKNVSEQDAKTQDAYTELNGSYYIVA